MSHNVQSAGRWPSEMPSSARPLRGRRSNFTTFNPMPGMGFMAGGIVALGVLLVLVIQFGGAGL